MPPKKKAAKPRSGAKKATAGKASARKAAPRKPAVRTGSRRATSRQAPARKATARKGAAKRRPAAQKKAPAKSTAPKSAAAGAKTFPAALAELLKSRGITVPSGLKEAPRQAYAGQPASVVEILSKLSNADLASHAEKVAGYAKRQAERSKAMWDQSPLIAELRNRKLNEPARPPRVVGAAFSFKKPLREWTDQELLAAAREWSRRGKS